MDTKTDELYKICPQCGEWFRRDKYYKCLPYCYFCYCKINNIDIATDQNYYGGEL